MHYSAVFTACFDCLALLGFRLDLEAKMIDISNSEVSSRIRGLSLVSCSKHRGIGRWINLVRVFFLSCLC